MDLLTSAEAADYLRVSERKLYELVAGGLIPCTKVTGRWLFPRGDLDRWLRAGLLAVPGLAAAEPPPILGGSQDPLLDWALRESGSGLAVLAEGSEAGLDRLGRGEIVCAAIHLHALDPDLDANAAALAARADLREAVLIALMRREQGILTAPGNPLGLASLADVAQRRARLATRPRGAGAQLLLLALARRAGLTLDDFSHAGPPCPTGGDVAQAILAGRADAGIATRAVAAAAGLGFVPLAWERFDLAMRQRDYFRPPLQALLRFVTGEAFAAQARERGGYDTAEAGQVRLAR